MRRIAIIADVHADLLALEVALRAAKAEGVDAVWCLGDVIGRGDKPIECLERVFEACELVLLGNHEAVALDPAAHWEGLTTWGKAQFGPTIDLLAADERWPAMKERVSELEPYRSEPPLLLIHASPADALWGELDSQAGVYLIGRALPPGTAVVHGHTHIQTRGYFDPISTRVHFGTDVLDAQDILGEAVVFFNPGTVGLSKLPGRPVEWGLLTLDGKRPTRFEWRRTQRDDG